MKVPSTDLFDLIRSLSPSEKGHFKKQLTASRADSIMAELFDFIDGMEKYDEEKILDHFKGQKFVNNLSRTKNYLYQALLHAMRKYHGKVFARIQVKNMVSEVEVLHSKTLYKQSYTHLQLAKKKALKFECYPALIELLLCELTLIYYILPANKIEQEIASIRQQMEETKAIVNHSTPYFILDAQLKNDTLFSPFIPLSSKSNTENNLNYFNRTQALIDSPILEDVTSPKSTEAEYLRLRIKSYTCFKSGDHENSELYQRQCLKLFDDNPDFAKEHPAHFIATVSNLGIIYLRLKKFEEVEKLTHKFENVTFHAMIFEVKIAQFKLNVLGSMLMKSRDKERLHELFPTLEDLFNTFNHLFDPALKKVICLNLSIFSLLLKDYSKAITYHTIATSAGSFELRQDASYALELLYIAIHNELENWELLESKARSIARVSQLSDPEWKELAKICARMTRRVGRDKKVYETLRELLLNTESKQIKMGVAGFDFRCWAIAKIQNDSFLEVFAENSPYTI